MKFLRSSALIGGLLTLAPPCLAATPGPTASRPAAPSTAPFPSAPSAPELVAQAPGSTAAEAPQGPPPQSSGAPVPSHPADAGEPAVPPLTAPESSVPPAEAPDGKQPGPSAEWTALSNKVDEAQQQARIASRKVELLEEQLASAKPTPRPSPTVTADEKGFSQRSADGAYVLKVTGLVDADARWFLNDGVLSDRADTFLLRRFRPSLAGTVFGLVDFRFLPDFAGSAVVVLDAFVDFHPVPWARLRAGRFKPPIGLERLQVDADLPFMERALTQYLTPTRDIGASLWGELLEGALTYNAGIFNGAPDAGNPDVDNNHAKDFAFRLLVQPFKLDPWRGFGSLGLHFAITTGNRLGSPASSQLATYRTGGLNPFFNYLPAPAAATDPGVFANRRETRINPALFYYVGWFGILAEYVQSRQEIVKGVYTAGTTSSPSSRVTSASVATLTQRAAHATVSVVIGGTNGFEGATPTHRLDLAAGTLGAVEVAARWNIIKVDDATFGSASDPTAPTFADPTKSARQAQAWAVALTYVPSRTARFTANFEHTWFEDGAGTKEKTLDRPSENALLARAQVNF